MFEYEDLSNPDRYRILIQIKKNRRLKRKASYLTEEFDFSEDITKAKTFPSLHIAEQILPKVIRLSSTTARPRIVIKYLVQEEKSVKKRMVK